MRVLGVIAGVAAGVVLYTLGVVVLGGILSAVAIPSAYFEFFGQSRVQLALFLLNLGAWALPVALAVFALSAVLFSMRWFEEPTQFLAVASGMVLGFAYWQVASGAVAPGLLPWFAASNWLAPWAGVAVAAALLHRKRSQLRDGA